MGLYQYTYRVIYETCDVFFFLSLLNQNVIVSPIEVQTEISTKIIGQFWIWNCDVYPI
jgi:hypothetical protein